MRILLPLAAAAILSACSSEPTDQLPAGNETAIADDCLQNYDAQLANMGEGPFAVTATLRFEDSDLSPIEWLQSREESAEALTFHQGGDAADAFDNFKKNTDRFPAIFNADGISALAVDLGQLERSDVRSTVCALVTDDIKLDSVTSRMTN